MHQPVLAAAATSRHAALRRAPVDGFPIGDLETIHARVGATAP
jgi:hypothetical protein